MEDLYESIFKRKSFHLFRCEKHPITIDELKEIEDFYYSLKPKYHDIKTKIEIIKDDTRGADYALRFYSEEKTNYLINIGYLGQMMDLYLVSKDFGTLWYGIAKHDDLANFKYVIEILFAKTDSSNFRKDMYKSKRKDLNVIWAGGLIQFSNIIRYAPSACNSQSWFIENKDDVLYQYRTFKSGRIGIMPKDKVIFYTSIDSGIMMCFIELCLKHFHYSYSLELFDDNLSQESLNLIAKYYLK